MTYDNDESGVTVGTVKAALNRGLHGILKATFDEVLDLEARGNTFTLTAKGDSNLTAKVTVEDAGHVVKMQYEDSRTSASYVVPKNEATGAATLVTNNVCRDAAKFGARVSMECGA